MHRIRLTGLPQLRFAHVYGSPNYCATLPAQKNCIEISCLSQGSFLCRQDDCTVQAQAGNILCNLFRSPLHIRAAEHHEHRTVCFSVPYELAEDLTEDTLPLPLCTTDEACCRRCRRLIDEILLRHTTDPDGDLYCAGLFLQLLAELAECSRQPSLLQADGSYRHVRKAKEYIFAHLHEPIRQQEIAARLNITPEHLCTVFRRCEGIPMMTFINRIKLERIHTLIHREKLPLYRAAELFGYSDPNYVSRLYRKLFGTSITRDDSAV